MLRLNTGRGRQIGRELFATLGAIEVPSGKVLQSSVVFPDLGVTNFVMMGLFGISSLASSIDLRLFMAGQQLERRVRRNSLLHPH
jgi:hypothetical protein